MRHETMLAIKLARKFPLFAVLVFFATMVYEYVKSFSYLRLAYLSGNSPVCEVFHAGKT